MVTNKPSEQITKEMLTVVRDALNDAISPDPEKKVSDLSVATLFRTLESERERLEDHLNKVQNDVGGIHEREQIIHRRLLLSQRQLETLQPILFLSLASLSFAVATLCTVLFMRG